MAHRSARGSAGAWPRLSGAPRGAAVAALALVALLAIPIVPSTPSDSTRTAIPAGFSVQNSPSGTSSAGAAMVDAAVRSLQQPAVTLGVASPGWTNLDLSAAPSSRTGAAIAFDQVLGATVLFGGETAATYRNDTWEFHNGAWTQIVTHQAPPPRAGASMAWDAADGYLFLFGGRSASGFDNDSWAFNGTSWSSVVTRSAPSPRADAGFAAAAEGVPLVLFGGTDGAPLGDTWTYLGGNWTQVEPTGSPPARSSPSMATDPQTGSIVLFGGFGTGPENDTWEYRDGNWTEDTPSTAPSPRSGAGMDYDQTDGYLVVVGGNGTRGPLNDTWSFRSGTWTELLPPRAPLARSYAAVVYDLVAGAIVLFGGASATNLFGDTWEFRAEPANGSFGWFQVATNREPTDRTQAAFAFDPADGYVVMFGGQNQSGNSSGSDYYGDTWTYRAGIWTQYNLTPSPSPRRGSMMTYDPTLGALVLFGGSTLTAYDNDTWEFVHLRWTNVSASVAPSPRRSSGFAYDPSLGGIILYGGHNNTGGKNGWYYVFNDTWLFRQGTWTELSPVGKPGPRAEPIMAYDPQGGYIVMYAGYQQNGSKLDEDELNTTWTFSGDTWTNITTQAGRPSHRDGAGFEWDPAAEYLLEFGGDDNVQTPVPNYYEFSEGQWVKVCQCAAPTWAADHAAFDEADGFILSQSSAQSGSGDGPRIPGASVSPASRPVQYQKTWEWGEVPFVQVRASTNATDVGRDVNATAWYGGGTPPVELTWSARGSASTTGTAAVTWAPTVPGPTYLTAWLNGTGSDPSVNVSVLVQVHAAPAATLRISPPSQTLGTSVTVSGGVDGGMPPISWNLSGLPPGCGTTSGLNFSCTPTSVGNFAVTLRASDGLGESSQVTVGLSIVARTPTGPPTGSSGSGWKTDAAILGPVAIVVVGLLVYVVWNRRRAPPPGLRPYHGPGVSPETPIHGPTDGSTLPEPHSGHDVNEP
jgi:hypothetical protein